MVTCLCQIGWDIFALASFWHSPSFPAPRQLLLLARATHVAGEHASGTEWKETMAELASYVQNF